MAGGTAPGADNGTRLVPNLPISTPPICGGRLERQGVCKQGDPLSARFGRSAIRSESASRLRARLPGLAGPGERGAQGGHPLQQLRPIAFDLLYQSRKFPFGVAVPVGGPHAVYPPV